MRRSRTFSCGCWKRKGCGWQTMRIGRSEFRLMSGAPKAAMSSTMLTPSGAWSMTCCTATACGYTVRRRRLGRKHHLSSAPRTCETRARRYRLSPARTDGMSSMIPTSSRLPVNKRSEDDALGKVLKEIAALIGMDNVKDELNQLIALGRLVVLRRERDIPMEKISLHLIFTGPPGTGKTIMARKIGDLFKAVGLLRKGHVVEVDRSKLTGAHLGAAGQLVREAVKDAL